MSETKLLVRFRTTIDWLNYEDWTYDSNFSFGQNYVGVYYVNCSGIGTLSKEGLLQKGKRYRITFSIEGWTAGSSLGGIRIGCGSYLSNAIINNGEKTIVTDICDSDTLTINSLPNTDIDITSFSIEEIGYTQLELFSDTDISLNYQFKDIQKPESVSGNYTNEISLPGTSINNKFFKYSFNINEDNVFNMGSKCDAVIQVDEQTLEYGYIKLDNIIHLDDLRNYTIVFYGKNISMFSDIGEDTFDVLDFSDLDHTLTSSNIVNSWSNFPDSVNYVYPYIDYGDGEWVLQGVNGRASATNGTGLIEDDFYPAISVKYCLDKIFDKYGYTYTSDLINSDQFKQLVLPYWNSNEDIKSWVPIARVYPNTAYNDYQYRGASGGYTSSGKFIGGGSYVVGLNGVIANQYDAGVPAWIFKLETDYDYFNRFNTTTVDIQNYAIPGTYGVQYAGEYSIEVTFYVSDSFLGGYSSDKVYAFKMNADDFTWTPAGYNSYMVMESSTSEETTELFSGNIPPTTNWITETTSFNCDANDMIGIKHLNYERVHIKEIIIRRKGWLYNTPVEFNSVKPKEYKIKDFLKSLNNMFNLTYSINTGNTSDLIVEPYQDYLDNYGKTRNWTHKLDKESEIRIELPKDYLQAFYDFSYTEADDYMNDQWNTYKDQVGLGFGGKKIKTNNDFVTDEFEVRPGFKPSIAATPSVANGAYTYAMYRNKDYSNERNTNIGPRILYFEYMDVQGSNNFRAFSTNYSSMPYAGESYKINQQDTSSAYTLCYDLDISVNDVWQLYAKYRPQTTVTTNNLYNLYWSTYINSIINKDSRMVTLYLKLDINDLYDFQFADKVFIDGTYYRVHKIYNFNPNGSSLTKVELLKTFEQVITFDANVNTALPPLPEPGTITLGLNNYVGRKSIVIGDDNSSSVDSFILGSSNVGGKFIIGDYNRASSGSTIIGNYNVIPKDITAVIIDDYITAKENATYIDGVKINNGMISKTNVIIDPNAYIGGTYNVINCGENGMSDYNFSEIKIIDPN